jgi:hypothetical protein
MTEPSDTIRYYTADLATVLEVAYENSSCAKYTGSTLVYADEGLTAPIGDVCLNLSVYKKAGKQILYSYASFDKTTTNITGDVATGLTLKDGENVWKGGTDSASETGNFTDAVGVATGTKLGSGAFRFEVVYEGYYTVNNRR